VVLCDFVQQFATGPGYTILPNDPLYLKVIGQQVEWSFLDTKAVNSFYCDGLYTVSQKSEPPKHFATATANLHRFK